MSYKKWSLAVGFCLIVFIALATAKFLQVKSAMEFAASFPEHMETTEYAFAKDGEFKPEVSVIAETIAKQSIELRNELGGLVDAVHFKSGEIVEKGQLLLSLETRQEEAQLAAIRADVKLAKSEYKRMLSVVAKGAATESDLDSAEAQRDSMLADEQELIEIVNKKNIRAPFTGRTGLHQLAPGQYLNAGEFLTDLVGIDKNIWVDFSLPQQTAILHPGDNVEVSANSFFDGKRTATIIARDAMINSASRNVRFRAELQNLDGRLFPGMALTAHINTLAPIKGVFIPSSAIRYDTNGPYVFVLDKIENATRGTHHARKQPVTTKGEIRQHVLVTSGIKSDESVATLGSFKLSEGMLTNAILNQEVSSIDSTDQHSITSSEQ